MDWNIKSSLLVGFNYAKKYKKVIIIGIIIKAIIFYYIFFKIY